MFKKQNTKVILTSLMLLIYLVGNMMGFSIFNYCYAQSGDFAVEDVKDPGLLSIRELNEQGKYFEAVLRVEEVDTYRPLGEIISAAKSAWALSLVSYARKYWDLALSHKDCVGIEKARVLLAKSLLEFQERNYEQARGLAEEGASLIGESDLRGELWLLVGESLRAQELYSLSETYFEKAAKETSGNRKQEVLLSLAQVKKHLGKFEDSRSVLTKIELNSNITTKALTELVNIDANANNYLGVRTWVKEGRKSFPSEFGSSKLCYNNVRAMLADGLVDDAEKEIQKISKEVHAEDVWLQLSRSILEEHKGNLTLKEAKN